MQGIHTKDGAQARKKPSTMWNKKEDKPGMYGISLLSHDEDDKW